MGNCHEVLTILDANGHACNLPIYPLYASAEGRCEIFEAISIGIITLGERYHPVTRVAPTPLLRDKW